MDASKFGARDVARLPQLSRYLARACLWLMVGLPVGVAWMWWRGDAAMLAVAAKLPPQAIQSTLLGWQRWIGAATNELPVAALLFGVWQARRCFLEFAAGRLFSAAAVRHLKRFAAWMFASVLLNIAAGMALSVLLTLGNARGQRSIALGLDSDQLLMVFFAAMVWLMAAVIGQGQALAEENATFV